MSDSQDSTPASAREFMAICVGCANNRNNPCHDVCSGREGGDLLADTELHRSYEPLPASPGRSELPQPYVEFLLALIARQKQAELDKDGSPAT
jgi:hypothetical protein